MNFPPGFLVGLLSPEGLTAVVDVGANPLHSDGTPPYTGMLAQRLCTVVGHEPQTIAIAAPSASSPTCSSTSTSG